MEDNWSVMGIEPTLAAWEAAVLPLNYTRVPPVYSLITKEGNSPELKLPLTPVLSVLPARRRNRQRHLIQANAVHNRAQNLVENPYAVRTIARHFGHIHSLTRSHSPRRAG